MTLIARWSRSAPAASRSSRVGAETLRLLLSCSLLLATSLLLLQASASPSSAQWEVPAGAAVMSFDDSGWWPNEISSMGSVNSMAGFERHMTDRELFQVMATATGQPEPEPQPEPSSTGPADVDQPPPVDEPTETPPPTGNTVQPNGLPFGVVRARLELQPAPSIPELAAFHSQFLSDMGSLAGVSSSRMEVQGVSTSGSATTVIWDFKAPGGSAAPLATRKAMATLAAGDEPVSQSLYDRLIGLKQDSFADKPVLKDTVLASISQMCDDGSYQRTCGDDDDKMSTMMLAIIIGASCLGFICIVSCIIYACVRSRRRNSSPDSLKMGPMYPMGTELIPAKRFAYTAPNSQSGQADEVSEVTVLAKGAEFEPSHHSVSGSGSGSGSGSDGAAAAKNRLAPKFPNKSSPIAAGAGAAAAGLAVAGAGVAARDDAKEDSQKSLHFYYVDEASKVDGGRSRNGSNSGSRNHSRNNSVVFSLNDGGRNELSRSASRSAVSQSVVSTSHSNSTGSQPSTPRSEQRRRASVPSNSMSNLHLHDVNVKDKDEGLALPKDKTPLPVVRPGQARADQLSK